MHDYDIVFIGHINKDTVVPFQGPSFTEECSPVTFAAVAASCSGRRIAAVTRVGNGEEYLLEPLKDAGVHLFVQPGETTEGYIVFPTANVDQRQIYRIKVGEPFAIDEIPPFEPCLAISVASTAADFCLN